MVISNNFSKQKPEDRSEEIKGGLKNALSRGENIQKAKQSFINAGYSRQEVEKAASTLNISPTQHTNQNTPANSMKKEKRNEIPQKEKTNPANQVKKLPQDNKKVPTVKKPFPKWIVISLIVLSIIVLLGAAVFFIYWDQIIG